ncbi:hypothetical protein DL89DRAFT_71043 [Linderina pennispora]|uniref:Uncharacterized protein n=1 Tax=Linderina pennispora TaxID=61395 RepID=A0A1Y1VR28_9FUNG|nr:uncharacterized protein DL89DRAFT_71043 [Linderina pennispora]ORX63727.1 hypothetical protein DL89DRAFT_71043 [Linderina pennispora]
MEWQQSAISRSVSVCPTDCLYTGSSILLPPPSTCYGTAPSSMVWSRPASSPADPDGPRAMQPTEADCIPVIPHKSSRSPTVCWSTCLHRLCSRRISGSVSAQSTAIPPLKSPNTRTSMCVNTTKQVTICGCPFRLDSDDTACLSRCSLSMLRLGAGSWRPGARRCQV